MYYAQACAKDLCENTLSAELKANLTQSMEMKSAFAMAVLIAGSNSFTLSEVTSTMGTESKSEVPEELLAIVSDFGEGVAY